MDIKLVITDVDGCLTDGGVTYTFIPGLDRVAISRTFSTLDGEGFAILKRNGIAAVIVTQSESKEIEKRAKWLDVTYLGSEYDKEEAVYHLGELYQVELEEICFFGNDIIDLKAMKIVGLPACPADAHWSVLEYVEENGWVTKENGGRGAFRRLVDIILAQQ